MKKVFICLSVVSLFIIGCSKTNEEAENKISAVPGGSVGTCDTIYMRYKTDIQPILQANCVRCHNDTIANRNVRLNTYEGVKQQADRTRNNLSVLLGVITHTTGFAPMPRGRPKLSECEINKIKDWVSWKALNN